MYYTATQVMQPILAVSIAKGTQHSKSFDRSSAKCLKAAQKSIKFLCLHTMSQALARMQLGLLASLSTQECTQVSCVCKPGQTKYSVT
eukprot:scaffold186507_cov24-Tisochrysis_lutea.AAC.1